MPRTFGGDGVPPLTDKPGTPKIRLGKQMLMRWGAININGGYSGKKVELAEAASKMGLDVLAVSDIRVKGEKEEEVGEYKVYLSGVKAGIAQWGVGLYIRKEMEPSVVAIRWSQGLVFHQALVDCARAAILLPLAVSILRCQPVHKCSLVETAFLLLVTVSTVNMLTTVLNDSPVFPQDDETEEQSPLLMDSPQCVLFGTFMIWFASITINLGPTFLSGALAASAEVSHNAPSCPLVHGPFRHYVLNVLWIAVNVVCVLLTLFHLHKLHRDLTKANVQAVRVAGLVTTLVSVTGGSGGGATAAATGLPGAVGAGAMSRGLPPGAAAGEKLGGGALAESRRMRNYLQRVEREGVQRVKMFLVITAAYVVFWGPLFLVTLVHRPALGSQLGYEITLHVAYVHAFVQPTLFLVLHHGLRQAALESCCRPRTTFMGSSQNTPRQRMLCKDNAAADDHMD
ncbi:uncharacterized protein LOC126101434 [Schistocerca cancellata]|uniref:uncharacterized protein LOC126101434 n=1 Tax=Schistocerca cancellata TaxID=274614 RepID=UPI002118E30D|nr:uncharacterized protein LOC126101434 [Schistocerca cancellata]